jgi:Domain of unknown function (DUF4062)
LRIFVSSIFKDLKEERLTIRDVIHELACNGYNVKWIGMDDFGSLATTPLQSSVEFAKLADLMILLVADSYGTVPPDGQRSFTHEQYEIIRQNKIPCLAYLKDPKSDHHDPQVERFRTKINLELVPYTFSDKIDLALRVRQDLKRELEDIILTQALKL